MSDPKECFIITPIGGQSSPVRREADGLIKTVFSPVLNENGFSAIAAHQISETGSITKQVVRRIIESDLVIANLTDLNPNVMYELGIRHCVRKPVIVVAREDVTLPFDLSDERTVFYRNDMYGVEELKNSLRKMVPKAVDDSEPDNPVYRVVDVDLVKYSEVPKEIDKVVEMRLSKIEDHLEEISRQGRLHSLDMVTPAMPRLAKATFSIHKKDLAKSLDILRELKVSHRAPLNVENIKEEQPVEIAIFNILSSEAENIESILNKKGVDTFPF